MKKYFYILLLVLITSCGISEDCFKGNGNPTTLSYTFENFTKVKVYSGIGLVVKEGPEYDIKIETRDNIKDNIEVTLQGDMLIIKDNSTCNIARDYGSTIVYITAPNLEEIHSKTEQVIKSDGILHFPELRLFSMGDDGDGAGTGDFYMSLFTDNIYIESNGVSNFYLDGESINLNVFFAWGDGKFFGSNLKVTYILNVEHRGSNDIYIFPLNKLTGNIFSTGNVILENIPNFINVTQHYSGHLIYN